MLCRAWLLLLEAWNVPPHRSRFQTLLLYYLSAVFPSLPTAQAPAQAPSSPGPSASRLQSSRASRVPTPRGDLMSPSLGQSPPTAPQPPQTDYWRIDSSLSFNIGDSRLMPGPCWRPRDVSNMSPVLRRPGKRTRENNTNVPHSGLSHCPAYQGPRWRTNLQLF